MLFALVLSTICEVLTDVKIWIVTQVADGSGHPLTNVVS